MVSVRFSRIWDRRLQVCPFFSGDMSAHVSGTNALINPTAVGRQFLSADNDKSCGVALICLLCCARLYHMMPVMQFLHGRDHSDVHIHMMNAENEWALSRIRPWVRVRGLVLV